MTVPIIKLLRARHPITFTVANSVTSNKVADALSAVGASPIMSAAPQEAQQLVKLAHAMVLNLGTPTTALVSELLTVAQAANQAKTPLVLDPVACASTDWRWRLTQQLLTDYHFTIIRGNAGEIACLTGIDWKSHGIDAGFGYGNLLEMAKQCARQYHTTVILSGPRDIITDGYQVLKNNLSSPWLAVNVGSGDILSSIIGAILGCGTPPLTAGLAACQIVTRAGSRADTVSTGLGSWRSHFLDELSLITDHDLANIERNV